MTATRWGVSPRQSVEAECSRRGRTAVVEGCRQLLRGEAVDGEFVVALGGPPARWAVEGGEPGPAYWTRVWATRGLLWAWDDAAFPELAVALSDESWRVREMAGKVVRRHLLEQARPQIAALENDAVARVRRSATQARAALDQAQA